MYDILYLLTFSWISRVRGLHTDHAWELPVSLWVRGKTSGFPRCSRSGTSSSSGLWPVEWQRPVCPPGEGLLIRPSFLLLQVNANWSKWLKCTSTKENAGQTWAGKTTYRRVIQLFKLVEEAWQGGKPPVLPDGEWRDAASAFEGGLKHGPATQCPETSGLMCPGEQAPLR